MTDRGAASKVIERWNERNREAPYGVWAVEERTTGTVAGTVLLVPLPEPSDGTAMTRSGSLSTPTRRAMP